ncbi:MAG TPA: Crp/Fnr family transcriptional regulator [Bacteroidales bacterium]|nr:Crp/Fnr family transcriptional regulator [Bacteroidales bacterium]
MIFYQENTDSKVPCGECTVKSCAAAVLKSSELDLVNQNSRATLFRKGDIILHEGSMTSHIIYLKSGLVKEFRKGPGETEQILQIVKPFTYLGLPSLFGDRINHYSYAALQDISVCYIDLGIFTKLIRDNGNFAFEILVSVSRDSLNNFHRFMSQSQKKTFGRVADALIYFSEIIYEQNSFELPFSRQEFADLIGISRESATRVLTKFRDDGLLRLTGRRIEITNIPLLRQISKNG